MPKSLLFISALAPFPQESGGAVRLYQTIKNLGVQFKLTLVFLAPADYVLSGSEKKFLDTHCQSWTRVPLGRKRRGAYFRFGQPYWLSDWWSSELKQIVWQLGQKQQFDFIQLEPSQLLYLQPQLPPKTPKILVAYDLNSRSFARRLIETKQFWRLPVTFWRWWGVWRYEKKYLPQFNLVIAMSEVDAAILQKKFGVKKVLVVPNGVEQLKLLPAPKTPVLKLGYIGPFAHTPNQRAVFYFITKIAPWLERQRCAYQFYLAGQNDPELVTTWVQQAKLAAPKKIINLGWLPHASDFYRQIDVLVVPLFSGSGTRLKILEALAAGKKVIATPIGAEGLDTQKLGITLATTPQDFATALKNFDPQTWQQKLNALTDLTWTNIFQNYQPKIQTALK